MVSIIEKMKDEIESVNEKYSRNADDIFSDYNTEKRTAEEYRGRQIYELLQNADDCYTTNINNIEVNIELQGNLLIIQNTGKAFDETGLESLMHPDTSSKYEGTIGCKGLGFRSVLNWAYAVKIVTEDFCLDFSEKAAKEQLEKYKNVKNIRHRDRLERIDRIAILCSVKISTDKSEINKYLNKNYSTSVVLWCENKYLDKIKKELTTLQFEELLFLKHIRKIIIKADNLNREIESIKENTRCLIQESGQSITEWMIWNKEGKIELPNGNRKKYELAIAYNTDLEQRESNRKNGKLYSYFKTDIQMPFPFLVHGTFELESDRNGLIKDSIENEKIIDILVDFIVQKGVSIAELSNACNYDVLKFLVPSNNTYELDEQYNFTSKLVDKIRKYKLFPTIGNEYISINDNPKFKRDTKLGDYVNKKTFKNLLQPCGDESIIKFINDMGIEFYSSKELTGLLEIDADEYIKEGVNGKIIKLYYDSYDSYYLSNTAPKLLVDSNGERITSDVRMFLNPKEQFVLPQWSHITFIDNTLENNLHCYWGLDNRKLISKLSAYHLEEYSFDKVVRELLNQCQGNAEKNKDFIRWLYGQWKVNGNKFKTELTGIDIKLLCRDGSAHSAKKCYLGHEYSNEVGERLTSFLEETNYIVSGDIIGIDGSETKLLVTFFGELGVNLYPAIQIKELSYLEGQKYLSFNKIKYPTLWKVTSYMESYDYDTLFSQWDRKIKVATIDGITNILENADFYDILYWLLTDDNINKHVKALKEIDDCYLAGKPYKAKNYVYIENTYMICWIHELFAKAKWIPTKSGKKVSSNECTIEKHKLSPLVEVIDIDYSKLENMLHHNVQKDVAALLEHIGIVDNVLEMTKEKIYDILLRLPELEDAHLIAKELYAQLNLTYKSDMVDNLISNNAAYEKFKKEGKVLAQKNGVSDFYPVEEVFYVEHKTYSEDILSQIPTLILNRRAGESKIEKLFCVKPVTNLGKVKISYKEHSLIDEYNKDFKKLLPYFYAKRLNANKQKKQLNELKKIKIILVKDAHTEFLLQGEPQRGELGDYEMIYDEDKDIAYVKIPSFIDNVMELKKQIKFRSVVAEVITTVLDVSGDKDAFMNIVACNSIREVEEYFRENGDEQLTIVNMAKEYFKQDIDYKYEFWSALSNASKLILEDLRVKYESYFPTDFDYKDFTKNDILDNIVKLFSAIETDVNEYNLYAYEHIDLRQYYYRKYNNIRSLYANRYFYYKATQLVNKEQPKEKFEAIQRDYNGFEPNFKNSVYENVRQIYENKFNITINDLAKMKENYREILVQYKVENDASQGTATKSIDNIQEDIEVSYEAINKEIEKTTTSEAITAILSKPNTNTKVPVYTNVKNRVVDNCINKKKEEDGFLAESKVYNTLKKRYPDSVYWVSGNGAKAKVTENGDDTLGYDMWYTNDDGKHLVEVKGTSYESLEFTLTKNELETAQKNKLNYEIWFVFIKDGIATTPYELGNIFMFKDDEDFFNNSRFTVETKDYHLKSKIINKG